MQIIHCKIKNKKSKDDFDDNWRNLIKINTVKLTRKKRSKKAKKKDLKIKNTK